MCAQLWPGVVAGIYVWRSGDLISKNRRVAWTRPFEQQRQAREECLSESVKCDMFGPHMNA
jgi:hypothetical protein